MLAYFVDTHKQYHSSMLYNLACPRKSLRRAAFVAVLELDYAFFLVFQKRKEKEIQILLLITLHYTWLD